MRRHRRPGGRLGEAVLVLILLMASVAVPIASYVFSGFAGAAFGLSSSSAGKFGLLGGAAGLLLMIYPWSSFLRYYNYGAQSLRSKRGEEE